jgi:hypothetical protein
MMTIFVPAVAYFRWWKLRDLSVTYKMCFDETLKEAWEDDFNDPQSGMYSSKGDSW